MNHQIETVRPRLDSLQRLAIIIGGIGLILCVVGAIFSAEQFFHSYLYGYMFWIGLGLGSFGILMLHNLVGGPWGFSIRRVLQSGARTLPVMALLFIPLLFGIHSLYEWSHTDVVAKDHVLHTKAPYLNETFFLIRTAIYFLVWIGVSSLILRSMRRLEEQRGAWVTPRLQNLSAVGILLFVITVTFAAIDWVMSLEPHWFSTMYGLIFVVGQGLATFAFAVAMLVLLMNHNPSLKERILPVYFHDLGNFLFAFTMLWAYVSFSQYLIIWSANLPEETPWYVRRSEGILGFIPLVLFAIHFALPFLMLLNRKVKRNPNVLARVALLIIVMRFIDLYWTIMPAFSHEGGVHFHWLDLVAPIGIGGIWFASFLFFFKKNQTLLPLNWPLLQEKAHD